MANITVSIDAADFIDNLEEGYTIADSNSFEGAVLHNNLALVMDYPSLKDKSHRIRSQKDKAVLSNKVEDIVTQLNIPESGRYRLYVRSQGELGSDFRIYIDDKVDGYNYANEELGWKKGGIYELAKGQIEVRIQLIKPVAAFDVLVLTSDESFRPEEISFKQFPDDVELLKEYSVDAAHTVKFGLIADENKMGFITLDDDWSTTAYNHDGEKLWSYQAPPLSEGMKNRAGYEAGALIWDIDRDGSGEVIHWRYIDDSEWLVVADGKTGEIKYKTKYPSAATEKFFNYRLAVARLNPDFPDDIIVFADSGGDIRITAFDSKLNKLWSHTENRPKDNLGHYIYPKDINDDGIDEIIVGAMALDPKGEVIWETINDDNHFHVDSMRFADINGDGIDEMIAVYSDLGVHAIDISNGETIWSGPAEHAQQVEVGNFIKEKEGLQIAAGARTYSPGKHYLYGQIYWYDAEGNLLNKWPKTSINGNPDFLKGDWYGDGKDQLFWLRFRIDETGKGVLSFPEQVYHCFDFTGEGVANVITTDNGKIKVYGCKNANRDKTNAKRDIDYLYRKVVNHTHY
ncbi:hypothetical protein [Natronospora cellulosivora (SeqCode)]